jgi:UDP-glucose 4-epimerase
MGNKMKSIVTGGSGFIGSHIVDKLIELGHEVIVIDNESAIAHEQFYYNEKASYHKIDIADYCGIRPLFEGVDYVFHLAAESRIQPAIANPLLCVNTNVYGTSVVLQCARESGVRKVIYSSTSSAYGLKNSLPLEESMPNDCLNPYSVAKVAGEEMCKMYTKLFGLKTITLRYFNVYGPREPTKGQYAPVVGLFLRQKKAGESLTVVGDGTQKRDFTHVDDVVDANIKAMNYVPETFMEDMHGTTFNVGTGTNHSIIELAKMISDNIEFIPPRPAESKETLANNLKIKAIFGWSPSKDIEDYVKENL